MRESSDAPDNAQRAARLRELHWELTDARNHLVDTVYRYGHARKALIDELAEADSGWLLPERYEEMRRDADLAAIHDWPRIRAPDAATTTRFPALEEAVIDAET